MTNVYEVGVVVHLVDKVSAALAKIAVGFTRSQTAAAALQAQMNKIHSTFNSGMIMMAGGAALAAPLVHATHAAMELQTALGRVQIATGASKEQMDSLNDVLTKTANATGIFSKPTLAAFAADMYSSGITQMDQLNRMLPMFAKGADIMKIISHGKINPEQAAHTFSALAHQFGRYTEEAMKPIVEAAVAIAPALPGGLKTLSGMGSYVNVMGNRLLGVDPRELMALQAAIAQTSGGVGTGRGAMSGANLINSLKRSMPGIFGSGLLSGQSAFSAEVLGLAHGGVSTIFKDGKLSLSTLIDKLSSFESMSGKEISDKMLAHVNMLGKKAPEWAKFLHNFQADKNAPKAQLIARLLQSQFGSASTIAQLFGEEKFKTLLKSIMDRIKSSQSIEQMQAKAMEMLEPQLMRLQTNFTTLASTIGMQMIPVLTPIVTKLGDLLDKANEFASAHPRIVQAGVGLLSAASALLMVGGAARVAQAAFMGLRFVMPVVGSGMLRMPAGLFANFGAMFFAPLANVLSGMGGKLSIAFGWIMAPVLSKVGTWLTPIMTLVSHFGGIFARFGGIFTTLFANPIAGGLLRAVMVVGRFAAGLTLVSVAIIAVVAIVQNWNKVMELVHRNSGFFLRVAAEMAVKIDYLGKVFNICTTFVTTFANSLLQSMSQLPFIGNMAKTLQGVLKQTPQQTENDAATLRRLGYGGLVDTIVGAKNTVGLGAKNQVYGPMPVGAKSAGPLPSAANRAAIAATTHNNVTAHITVQTTPGHDHEKCAKTMVSKLKQVSSASTGGSVGRPLSTHGNYR